MPVPNESEPPRPDERPAAGAGWRGRSHLILAGLIPGAMTLLALALWPSLNLFIALPAPFVANLIVGEIAGRSLPARQRFFRVWAVALAGWIAGALLTGLVYFALVTPFLLRAARDTEDQGFGVFLGMELFLGLTASPIAAIVGAARGRRADAPPSTGASV